MKMEKTTIGKIAGEINQGFAAKSNMKIGEIITHPKGYKVKVTSGQFLRNGRVSNFWTWFRVNEDGTLGEEESGYGW